MRRTLSTFVVAASLPLAAAAAQKFKSGVDVVRVDALVMDGRKPITGLAAADFELRDNGVVQPLASVDLEALPLSVIFVLDTSGSVAGSKMWNLNAAVDLLLHGLHDADRAALVTFSHRVWLRTPLIADFHELRTLLASAEAQGGTALYDAVFAALAISDVQDSRPLLVVFSDGLDNMSWMSAELVERAARRANAVVYGVSVAASTRMETRVQANHATELVPKPDYQKGQTEFLDRLATTTGGRVLKADLTSNLPKAFDEILREFRTRYVLTYSPRGVDTPGWHQIAVKVKGRTADVRARTGYQK
jgi:VWFA-related protein